MSDETGVTDTEEVEAIEIDETLGDAGDGESATPETADSPAETVQPASAEREDDDDERTAIEKQPYAFESCTISISIQLMPTGVDGIRPVVFGIHSHGGAPSRLTAITLLELGALPAPIEAALRDFQAELPARGEAAAAALAKEKSERAERRARLAAPRAPKTAGKTPPAKKKKGLDLSAAPLIPDSPIEEATPATAAEPVAPPLTVVPTPVVKPPAPPPPEPQAAPRPAAKTTPAIQTGQAVSLFD